MIDPYRVVFLVALVGVLSVSVAVGTVGAQSAPDCSTVSYNGDGTEANPYEVGGVDQLQCIEEQGLDANYVQVSDIDASGTSEWNNGKGFEPIGELNFRREVEFNGTFNGQNHDITGLTINRSSEKNIGLFGAVGSAGKVTNVSILNIDIDGSLGVGGLVGFNFIGTTTESYATGDVNGSTGVGGLVGNNEDGTITESYANVSVNGSTAVGGLVGGNLQGTINGSYANGPVNGSLNVGGLVGINTAGVNKGTISESYATGTVDGHRSVGGLVGSGPGRVSESHANGSVNGSFDVGGLVGDNIGPVSDSYADGSVNGSRRVGGLVGKNAVVNISESYATGDVNGDSEVGGLVGENGGNVKRSYATGSVSGNDVVGGLVGRNDNDAGTVTESYWDTETTGQQDSEGGTGLTTSEMTGSAATSNMQGFDFTSTWETVTNPDDYPILAFQTEDGPEPANFEVTIDSTNSPVTEGDTLTVTATVTNTGGQQGTQDVTASASGLGPITRTVTLESGQSKTETVSIPTTAGDSGTFTITVETDDDTATETVTVEQDGGGGDDPTDQEVIDAVRSAGDDPNEIERDSLQNAIFEFVTRDTPTFEGTELTREGLQAAVFEFVAG
jgi:hypothetical protein